MLKFQHSDATQQLQFFNFSKLYSGVEGSSMAEKSSRGGVLLSDNFVVFALQGVCTLGNSLTSN